MSATFQFPPDLFALLVDTIPRLVRGKGDVLLFFAGAGTPEEVLRDLRARVVARDGMLSKFGIASAVLERLNARGDAALAQRRAVLRRVVEFRDFSGCYDDERLAAQGLVANVRALVGAVDSVTRMTQERDAERAVSRAEKRAELERAAAWRGDVAGARDALAALYGEADPHRRGAKLEEALNRLFALAGLQVREAFALRDPSGGGGVFEQIDGVVALDYHYYLVEMKWWASPLGPGDVAQHQQRVFARGQARGLFVAANGYTPAAVAACREQLRHAPFVLAELREILELLDDGGDLAALLRRKVEAAVLEKNPLHRYVRPTPGASGALPADAPSAARGAGSPT
jgi:hypothetical protein